MKDLSGSLANGSSAARLALLHRFIEDSSADSSKELLVLVGWMADLAREVVREEDASNG